MPGIQNGRVCTLWRCNDKILGLGGFWSAPPLCLGRHGTAGRKGLLTMFSRRKRISLWGTLLALVLYAIFTLTFHTSRILSVVHSADPESVFPLVGQSRQEVLSAYPQCRESAPFSDILTEKGYSCLCLEEVPYVSGTPHLDENGVQYEGRIPATLHFLMDENDRVAAAAYYVEAEDPEQGISFFKEGRNRYRISGDTYMYADSVPSASLPSKEDYEGLSSLGATSIFALAQENGGVKLSIAYIQKPSSSLYFIACHDSSLLLRDFLL